MSEYIENKYFLGKYRIAVAILFLAIATALLLCWQYYFGYFFGGLAICSFAFRKNNLLFNTWILFFVLFFILLPINLGMLDSMVLLTDLHILRVMIEHPQFLMENLLLFCISVFSLLFFISLSFVTVHLCKGREKKDRYTVLLFALYTALDLCFVLRSFGIMIYAGYVAETFSLISLCFSAVLTFWIIFVAVKYYRLKRFDIAYQMKLIRALLLFFLFETTTKLFGIFHDFFSSGGNIINYHINFGEFVTPVCFLFVIAWLVSDYRKFMQKKPTSI